MANNLKVVSESDNELRVANYIVLFGGKDLEGEHFTKNTEFESSYTKTGRLYVDWEHGLAEKGEPQRDDILGYVDWKTAKIDDSGLWVERVLDRRNAYLQYLESLIEADMVGTSSEAAGAIQKNKETGEIMVWPLRRDTLTVNPAEPRMMKDNIITAIKKLAEVNPDLKALLPQEPGEGSSADATAGNTNADKKKRGVKSMDDKELQAIKDAAAADALKKDREERDAAKAALKAEKEKIEAAIAEAKAIWDKEQPPINEPGNDTWPTDVKDEMDRGDNKEFKTTGLFLQAVKNSVLYPGTVDPKLQAHKATGLSENVPADGGYLLSPQVAGGIFERMYEGGQILSRVASDNIGPNSNSMLYNAVDETSRADGSRWGGVLGYWLAEAGTKTASKPTFRQMELKLKKVAALCYATDELLEDATALTSWITRTVPEELRFQTENAIYNGNGVGKPLGIMNAPCLISPLRIDANEIDATDIANMWARRWAGVNDYVWLANPSIFPQLINLVLGNFPLLIPINSGIQGDPSFSIYGKPFIEVEYTAALGTTGDLMLASLSQYQTIQKGGVQAASSIHVNFTADETAFRFVYRIDGQPLWNSALTPFDAGNTLSPFVVLATASA